MASVPEESTDIYMRALREGSMPFERFVSRRDIRDVVDIPAPRAEIDTVVLDAIADTARDKACRLIPILGTVGSGKTHTYWAYKDLEHKTRNPAVGVEGKTQVDSTPVWSVVYVPCPLPPVRIIQHIYTCIMDELGQEVLEQCALNLVSRWAGKKDRNGRAKKKGIEEAIRQGLQEYPGSYADCIKVLATYALDKNLRLLAERWLFGEDLKEKQLDALSVNSTLESDDVCWAMTRLLTANAGRVFVFFFDDFFENVGPARDAKMETHFLDILRTFYSEIKNTILILTDNKENWPNTLALADRNLRSFMASPLEVLPFTLDDVKQYFTKTMEQYWAENHLPQPPSPLFPLNEMVLEILFEKTNGNPRNTVKLARLFVDKVVTGEVTLDELATDQVPMQIAPHEQDVSQKRAGAIKTAVASSDLPAGEAVEKLQKIIRVSDRVPIRQLAQVLHVEESSLWDQVFEWADRFRFRIDSDVLVLKGGDVQAFLLELGKLVGGTR